MRRDKIEMLKYYRRQTKNNYKNQINNKLIILKNYLNLKVKIIIITHQSSSQMSGISFPGAKASEIPSTSRMRATPARTHFCGGSLVLSWAVKT
jgi:hypothetical protein